MDLNTNGISDVWELKYNAGALNPSTDTDGDGQNNLAESIAGTNPFDPNDVFKVTTVSQSGGSVTLTWPTLLGKRYQVQSCTNLSQAIWINETSLLAGNGGSLSATIPASVSPKLFHIVVTDVDTDGDGLTDWEELQLGLDPTKVSTLGNGTNDLALIQAALVSTNVVSIQATIPAAFQDGLVPGAFTITRTGNINPITVHYIVGGIATTNDYQQLSGLVNIPVGYSNSVTINVVPLPSNMLSPRSVTVSLSTSGAYSLSSSSNATVIVYNSTLPTGTGLLGQYFDNASTTYSNPTNFTNLKVTRVDPTIDFILNTNGWPDASIQSNTFSVRWTGQVQPEFSEPYTFDARTDDGVKLWVNDQLIIDDWRAQTVADSNSVPINLQAGVRYDIKMEYFQNTGSAEAHLFWYSPSQVKEIIPQNRLYPATVTAAPTAITSPTTAVALLGAAFSYTNTAANIPTSFTVSALPPGLSYNPATGAISGTPTRAGQYQITIIASNAVGVAASVLGLQVIDTGSAITREIWTGIPGTNVTDIPVGTVPTSSNTLSTLEGVTDFGDNYGERIRGWLTAPVTGNYYFWIAASDSAELWISNDSDPVNKVKRAYVAPSANPAPPPTNGTGPRQWNVQANQKSPWLSLVAGQRYYVEVLHKAGVGTNDNVAVGWLRPDQGSPGPSEVVPGYALSPYAAPTSGVLSGTLYTATMLAQGTTASEGIGTATLRLSTDETQAILIFSYTNLTSAVTGRHIHNDPYLSDPSTIMFDIDMATPQPDGSYLWTIAPVGALSTTDIVEIIKESKAYMNIHTVNYPAGEINGHFTLANGAPTFTPPPAPPVLTDDHTSPTAASRFLAQATFGPTSNDVAAVESLGYDAWITDQFSRPASHQLLYVLANVSADPTTPYPASLTFNSWWQQSITAPDQLRQRIAFALSEILVVSESGVLQNNARTLSAYYDTLLDNAFGNFRTLLQAVTLTPAMGNYLDMRDNDKGDLPSGRHPDENYAREIQQLFSIGLYRMWPDGSLIMNAQGSLVPTYDQNVVMGYAAVFTGWNYNQTNQANGRLPVNFSPAADYINPMVLVPSHHDLGNKLILDNIVLPAAAGSQADPSNTVYDTYGQQDLTGGLDAIFNNQNVGPFICRQLIQRLVTSNPSRDYIYRVTQKFNDNGAGVRGDMEAVIRAILEDYEARSTTVAALATYGKQREPLLRITATARAFPSPPTLGGTYSQSGAQAITVTTTSSNRLASGNTVFLQFTSGAPPPASGGYSTTVTGPNAFTVNATGLASGTYSQSSNTLTLVVPNHGLVAGSLFYLASTSGSASNGVCQVASVGNATNFTAIALDSATRSGNCLIPKFTGGYVVTTAAGTNTITVSTSGNSGLNDGDKVYLNFTAGTAVSGQFPVASILDSEHFTVTTTGVANQTKNGIGVYPLVPPPLVRSGNVTVQSSTWNISFSDNDLDQTPLESPTVFNFFSPNFMFPGILASAGMTTPEFQLTSDSSVALELNFLAAGIITNQNSNSSGVSSFRAGNGAIVLDLGPWMTPAYTSDTGVPNLVDALNSLLIAGQLSTNARSAIVSYVANTNNFAYTTPTANQMRDRVRAVVHLLVTSPDFTIQK